MEAFTKEQEKFLIKLVRECGRNEIKGERTREYKEEAEKLGLDCSCGGCFVTYTLHGDLRGCIGCFFPHGPFYQIVKKYCKYALHDDRFGPMTLNEFEQVDIAVSMLTEPIYVKDPLKAVIPGVHGIIVSKGKLNGTYLPEVCTEENWDVKTFVTHCARYKAGIYGDVLNDPDVKWQTYKSIVAHSK
ncbi:protein MTH_857, putative [Entamoeba dispar SAW760]|uniref:Protein MTH_857, putative n=1 Tax=Entamoeba dispar (strain ATCC PRA-260 / SAW760) TaxID=370354 RepID=B0EM29_ENTDS|nr:protein MTH_857, putative [Entamoeba dispar SAW760]EDR24423.1 protein MTH_857, putative [Entamoeba dispar SAW760]|eukprot:EDR24423.1 protein MTH_857, putative [Entamoeba dispar SAW760]